MTNKRQQTKCINTHTSTLLFFLPRAGLPFQALRKLKKKTQGWRYTTPKKPTPVIEAINERASRGRAQTQPTPPDLTRLVGIQEYARKHEQYRQARARRGVAIRRDEGNLANPWFT